VAAALTPGEQVVMTTIHTIGHSHHSIEHFVALLRQHGVATLVDVRSRPYSRWAPQFQKDALSRSLAAVPIAYVFLGQEFGGRPEGAEFYDEHGHVDYERRTQAPDFRAGLDRLVAIARQGSTAIMCAEEDPIRCHRQLLVTPALQRSGVTVEHIRGDGHVQTEDELGGRKPQLRLFE
jgi:uncharacterized protein (DUF488 family)